MQCEEKRNFSRHKVDHSKHFFCLNDPKGDAIGSSQGYVTFAGVRKAIRAVKKHSVMAQIIRE
ncbi:DUF1508 domain-containing protein [Terrimonas ginsenosidimutans]|uniref:DUF1508 domain-containing protein n=1 Tax=Terrimonas ginsenosidimutans TaxID=2908004 RepID=UPI003D7964E7